MLQNCRKVYLYRDYRKSSLERFTARLSAVAHPARSKVGRLYADLSDLPISQAGPNNLKASQIPAELRFALSGPECRPSTWRRATSLIEAPVRCQRPLEEINNG